MTVISSTIGMKSSVSQALPASPETLPEKPLTPETSAPNQLRNIKMKRAIAEAPAIFSPGLSLSRCSIMDPPVELGVGVTLHARPGSSQRIYEQHCDRHRPHPTGHRRDRRRDLDRRLEINVSDQAIVGAVDAD